MKTQRAVQVIIYFAVFVWTVTLFVQHAAISPALLKPLSLVTTAVCWLVWAFEVWLWKWPLFQGWLVKRPVLEGTWKVVFESNWVKLETGEAVEPHEAFMVVRQTLTTLSLRQLTKESRSVMLGTELTCSPDGVYCVGGVYRNEPSFSIRKRSPIHYGGIWLEVSGAKPVEMLSGHYWTDRETAGTLKMFDRCSTKFDSFESAQAGRLNSSKLSH